MSSIAISETLQVEQLSELTLPELADQANATADEAESHATSTVQAAMQCGMCLHAAKQKVGHGKWGAWLHDNFSKTHRVANAYMRLANSKRASNLQDYDSIRSALRAIAGPKEGTRESLLDQAADMLRSGSSQSAVQSSLGIAATVVKQLYEDVVMPEFLEIDWRASVAKALVKEIAAVRNWDAISAEYRSKGITGGCYEWCAIEIGVSKNKLMHAMKILEDGVPQLIARAEAGEIALSTAKEIATLIDEEQVTRLSTMERKQAASALDDLRFRISNIADHRFGWIGEHGSSAEVFDELRLESSPEDIADIVCSLKLVHAWLGTIVSRLTGGSDVHD